MSVRRLFTALAAIGVVSTICVSASAPAAAQGRGYDCAHGPDTWRVRGVASWDRLNVRRAPGARSPLVGSIPHNGSGVLCVGPCHGNWCRVSWRGITGWTNMRYLGE